MKAIQYAVLGLAVFMGVSVCAAQAYNTLQLPPRQPARTNLGLTGNHSVASAASDFHTGSMAMLTPAPVSSRTADAKFFLLNGIHLGMAIFDVEMTQRCIASHHCRETNPVMPSSQGGQLSINFAIVGSTTGISYLIRKDGSKLWWLPPVAGAAVHSVGVATGFQHQ